MTFLNDTSLNNKDGNVHRYALRVGKDKERERDRKKERYRERARARDRERKRV